MTMKDLLLENVNLKEDLSSKENRLTEQEVKIQKLAQDILLLKEALKLLKQSKFGAKSEKLPPLEEQYALFNEAEFLCKQDPENLELDIDDDQITVSGHKRARGKRKPLPKELPREEIIIDLKDEEKICIHDGTPLKKIGEDVSEKLDIIPMQAKVIRTVRIKYGCPCCAEGVRTAPVPACLIPKSIATPGLLAFIAVSKYQDALPFYRLENIFERYGIEISRETMSRWMIRLAAGLRPLYNILQDEILASDYVHTDETTIQVLKEKDRTAESKSYMWVRARSYDNPIILFHYAPSRAGEVVKEILLDFKGTLQVDGYAGYNRFCISEYIKRMGCWAHVRRKFKDVQKISGVGSKLALQMLKLIQKLYNIETKIKDYSLDEKTKVRALLSKPILKSIKEFSGEKVLKVPPGSTIGKAFNYLLSEWPTLEIYLENGKYRMDNNFIENSIRPFAVGRKNWLFSDSVEGADASAIIYSLIETAKANNKEPYHYLKSIIDKLPTAQTVEDFEQLLPF